jgi:predicted DNA-binding transcriptional regulator AlpA
MSLPDPNRRMLDTRAAAEFLGVSKSLLDKRRLAGLPPRYRKIASAVRYAVADLIAFDQSCIRNSTSETPAADGGGK